jgi:hypothetical protein
MQPANPKAARAILPRCAFSIRFSDRLHLVGEHCQQHRLRLEQFAHLTTFRLAAFTCNEPSEQLFDLLEKPENRLARKHRPRSVPKRKKHIKSVLMMRVPGGMTWLR